MPIQVALKKQILEDGKITVEEARSLLDAVRQGEGFDPRDREDLRAFFVLHDAELEPGARELVNEVLVVAVRKLIAKIEERRASFEAKGRVREFVFGIQDGTMSTVGLLAGMQGATDHRALVVLAGVTAVVSGALSMASGAYLSARAEKDIVDNERAETAALAAADPHLAQEGILDALAKEGLSREMAYRVVKLLGTSERVLLQTFQEKVFGLGEVELNQPLKGAAVMALSFMLGGGMQVLPYVLMPGRYALWLAGAIGAATLFAVGGFKGRLAAQKPLRAGASFFAVAVGAAVLGYAIGLLADMILPGAGAAAAAG